MVEASRRETDCRVSTAAEYAAGDRQVSGDHARQELVEALQRKAAQSVAQTPVRDSRYCSGRGWRQSRRVWTLGIPSFRHPPPGRHCVGSPRPGPQRRMPELP